MSRKKNSTKTTDTVAQVESQSAVAGPESAPVAPESRHARRQRLLRQPLTIPEGAESSDHTITLPLLDCAPEGMYVPRHFELRLDNNQAANLKRLTFGLQMAGVEIKGALDALKWLLDQLANAE